MDEAFVALSLPPILIGMFAAIACALPGNFLILRRQALIGDAISHVVLPGIVVAFLVTGAVTTWPMMIGAAGAAVVAVVLIEAIKRLGRIEPGAAMGVTFTSLFAFGVLLLEQSDTSSVHLDVEHALYGNLESLIWLSAEGWGSLLDPVALAELPPELGRMGAVALLMVLLASAFWALLPHDARMLIPTGGMIDSHKPEPAMLLQTVELLGGGPTLYVGDSEIDAETARRAGIPFALYANGYRKTPVSEMYHDWVFDDFAVLADIVAEVMAGHDPCVP